MHNEICEVRRRWWVADGMDQVIYLASQPFTKKVYVGETQSSTYRSTCGRFTTHCNKSPYDSSFLYSNNRKTFHKFMFIELMSLDGIVATKVERVILEKTTMTLFKCNNNDRDSPNSQFRGHFHYTKVLKENDTRPFAAQRYGSKCRGELGKADRHDEEIRQIEYFMVTKSVTAVNQAVAMLAKDNLTLADERYIRNLPAPTIRKVYQKARRTFDGLQMHHAKRNLKRCQVLSLCKLRYKYIRTHIHIKNREFYNLINYVRRANNFAADVVLIFRKRSGQSLVEKFEFRPKTDKRKCNCAEICQKYPVLRNYCIEGHVLIDMCELATKMPMFPTEDDPTLSLWHANSRFFNPRMALRHTIEDVGKCIRPPEKEHLPGIVDRYVRAGTAARNFVEYESVNPDIKDLAHKLHVSVVDKFKGNLTFACIEVIEQIEDRYVGSENACKAVPGWGGMRRDNNNAFWKLDSVAKGLKRLRHHRLPHLKLFLKAKYFKIYNSAARETLRIADVKFRPLVGYHAHVYKKKFTIAAKVITHLFRIKYPHLQLNTIADFINTTEVENENVDPEIPKYFLPADIEAFFPSCDAEKGLGLIRAEIQQMTQAGLRRGCVLNSNLRIPPKYHSRNDKELIRLGADEDLGGKNHILFTKGPRTRNFDCLLLEEVPKIIKHDLNHSYFRLPKRHGSDFGKVYKQTSGVPIGSPFGPVVAQASALVEDMRMCPDVVAPGSQISVVRYVDDVLIRVRIAVGSTHWPDSPYMNVKCYDPRLLVFEPLTNVTKFVGSHIYVDANSGKECAYYDVKSARTCVHGRTHAYNKRGLITGHLHRIRFYSNEAGWERHQEQLLLDVTRNLKSLNYARRDTARTLKRANQQHQLNIPPQTIESLEEFINR